MNLLGLGPSRASVVRRTRIGFTRRDKNIIFSTKKVVSTNGNGGQDGSHQHEREEHRDTSHIDQGKSGKRVRYQWRRVFRYMSETEPSKAPGRASEERQKP